MKTIAHIKTDFPEKFGIPRQSSRLYDLKGEIIFTPEFRHPDAVKGLDGFDFIWLLWKFDVPEKEKFTATVRPPRLGGNVRMGVFATRSPFRPSNIGLSSVRISRIEWDTPCGPVIHVLGADIMDGTPILDIKPYLPFTDSHPDAKGGFTDEITWNKLEVIFPDTFKDKYSEAELNILRDILELDPRPHYQHQDERVYGMSYKDKDIHFRVSGDILTVIPD